MAESLSLNELPWAIPPGESILDILKERGWSRAEFAQRLGCSARDASRLLSGEMLITADTALRLERVTGAKAYFWLNIEAGYRERLARVLAHKDHADWAGWLGRLPLADLKQAGVIPNRRITAKARPGVVAALTRFFGVADLEQWRTCYGGPSGRFRRTRARQTDLGAVACWLRMGEVEAEQMQALHYDRPPRYDRPPHYNKRRFEKALRQIRRLTVLPAAEFDQRLGDLCLEAGVRLVHVEALASARAGGVARWLTPRSALIQLSLHGATNDRFWFTFFHEAAHILLHAGAKQAIYLDDPGNPRAASDSRQEKEADRWAAEMLIPRKHNERLRQLRTEEDVRAFAQDINIHPGIVVGRMQHEKRLPASSPLNRLKETVALPCGRHWLAAHGWREAPTKYVFIP